MRINVYEAELSNNVELVSATTDDGTFVGVRIGLKSPASLMEIDRESAITVWARSRKRLQELFISTLGETQGNTIIQEES